MSPVRSSPPPAVPELARAQQVLGRGEAPTLLVASSGGHLEQLLRLRRRLGPVPGNWEWATFDGLQSRALLRGERVHYVGYVAPRDLVAAARNVPPALGILRDGGYRAVVSTGSGVALPFFLAALRHGVPRYYIESAARSMGPSLTGRLVARIPRTQLFTQYPHLTGNGWAYCGSLFDDFEPGSPREATIPPGASPSRVVVTLGTMPAYGFRRAVERLTRTLPQVCAPDTEVLWQTGATDLRGLGVRGHDQVPADELRSAIQDADLVVMHGGIGSALTALDAGRVPVMLPRRVAFGEHVDDHQAMICDLLGRRRLAVAREADELQAADLWRAAHSSARAVAAFAGTSHRTRSAGERPTRRHRYPVGAPAAGRRAG